MAANNNISHAEMWDDSALVDSWNDALEEYKKYHSINARGKDVEEILKEVKEKPLETDGPMPGEKHSSSFHDQHAKKNDGVEAAADHDNTYGQRAAQEDDAQSAAARAPQGTPALPQHFIGQVHDQGLKNLLMSWYYAGYYTGLYEGQKQSGAGLDAKHEE